MPVAFTVTDTTTRKASFSSVKLLLKCHQRSSAFKPTHWTRNNFTHTCGHSWKSGTGRS